MQPSTFLSISTSRYSSWAGLVLCASLAGCGTKNEYVPPPPPAVTVGKAIERPIVDQLEYTGNLQATNVVQIRARVNGYLKSIKFVDGATVKAGEELFSIEREPFDAALASAEASKKKAEASLKFATAEFNRTVPLVKQGALSAQELDVKEADVSTASADLAAAEAAVTQAKLNLSYTTVTAPIDGRISRHMVDVGNLVEAQSTILTTIESYEDIYAYFNVSESDMLLMRDLRPTTETNLIKVEPASEGEAKPKGPEVFLGLPSDDGFPHPGELDFTQFGVDPSTGTQSRRARFKNSAATLAPGMFVRIRVPIGSEKPRVLVPERAVGVDQKGEYVLVVDSKNIVQYRPVTLGMNIGGMRIVEKGLTVDERIVVNGLQRARPNAEVTPTESTDLPGVASRFKSPLPVAQAARITKSTVE